MDQDPTRRAKVALIRPPVVVMPHSLATHGPTPPLGLAYVAGALRAERHDVQLIDAAGEAIDRCEAFVSPVGELHRIGLSPEEVVDRLDPAADVIGVTNMFLHEWPQVRAICELARERCPDALIVLGGENATAYGPRILQECPAVDCCVLGEGESTIAAVVQAHLDGLSPAGIAGVLARGGTATAGGPAERTSQVDGGLPVRIGQRELAGAARPAWDLVPLHKYWSRSPFFGVNRGRSMQVLGTRGCPYRCSFCSSPQMWTTRFVVRDPEDVVDEIAGYVDSYGVRNVNFVDLTAATNRKWTLALCDAFERRDLGITWQLPVGTRIESIDRQVLQRLHDTGCRNITFAPESGSERMLEVMDKRASLDHILNSVAEAFEIGLHTTVNIIVGHPAERWSDTARSLRFLVRAAWAGGDDCAVIMFCPYPGSSDYDELVASGRHQVDEAALYVGLSRSSSAHQSWNERMGPRQIRAAQLGLIVVFYATAVLRRPARLVEFARAQLTGREDTYLDQMVRTRRTSIRPVSAAEPARVPRRRFAAPLRVGIQLASAYPRRRVRGRG